MKFSIGYNFDSKLLDLLEAYKNNIEALYFPIPAQYLGSGRFIQQPANYTAQIEDIIQRCNSLNISTQLLLNATCDAENYFSRKFFNKLVGYIGKLKNLGLGSVVLANPIYIYSIKKEIKGLRIESSVNCFVKTIEHALYLKDLGVDVLTIDRDINRNIPLVKEIKNRTNLKIRLMLNEGCLRNCPFRVMHYNFLSHRSVNKEPMRNIFIEKFCINLYLNNPEKIFSIPFIPPDAIRFYASFVDYYKLSTRVLSTDRIEACLKAYINQQLNGNLLSILDCPGLSFFEYIDYSVLEKNHFFERITHCSENCNKCDYCKFLLQEAVVIKEGPSKVNKNKENRRAIRIYSNALKNSQENYRDKVSIYAGLSKMYINLMEYDNAFKVAHKVIKLAPKEALGYIILGSLYEKIKKWAKAQEVYKKALKILVSDVSICLGLARAFFMLKKFKEAIKTINKVATLNYNQSGIHLLLGLCYEKIGQYRKAIKEFEKEAKIDPDNAQINFLLARRYKNSNHAKRANSEMDRGVYKIKEYIESGKV